MVAAEHNRKRALIFILLLNLALIFTSLYLIRIRLVKKSVAKLIESGDNKKGLRQSTKLPSKRNILFQYRDSRPSTVFIVGDFNSWTPQKMEKGDNHIWKIILQLEPGEYKYQFVIDGKWIRDPYNSRSKPDGYGGENSLLIVLPLDKERE